MGDNSGNGQTISKILMIAVMIAAVIFGASYMNNRWGKLRDIRRQSDAQSIVKALDFYYSQYGHYPEVEDDDGDGWDKSNDMTGVNFLDKLVITGYLTAVPFDPVNDEIFYYRYKKFMKGEYGCDDDFYVFQIARFESNENSLGHGSCPNLDWTKIAPLGFTVMTLE
ncbi:hypothetical protein ISR92_01800 [Patescibacteria group bacterium]|nr:hypothetical protein [Patescibacteria group bacterium]